MSQGKNGKVLFAVVIEGGEVQTVMEGMPGADRDFASDALFHVLSSRGRMGKVALVEVEGGGDYPQLSSWGVMDYGPS